jgi:hypothetical protein
MKALLVLILALAPWAILSAQEAASAPPAADPDLPQPFDPNTLAPLIQNPPFIRSVNLSDSLMLTGMAFIKGKPIASLLDKADKKTYVVTEIPNEKGWRIAEAMPDKDLARSQIKLAIGGEMVTVRYNQSSISDAMKDGKSSPGGGERDDRGPRGDDRGYKRSQRGPSEEDRRRYETLSPEAREKFSQVFREPGMREKMMSMSEDDRRNYIRSRFEKIEGEDKARKK